MADIWAFGSDSEHTSSSEEAEEEVRVYKLRPRNQPIVCVPLNLPKNVAAVLDEATLERSHYARPIDCSSEVLEKVFTNYVIVKNILGHLPWQDKLVCAKVCTLWDSVVKRLRKEQIDPVDFSISFGQINKAGAAKLRQSGEFYTDPLVVFVFNYNTCDRHPAAHCLKTSPPPCKPACKKFHSILDVMYKKSAAPNGKFFGSKSLSVTYLPLPLSSTYDNAILRLLRSSQVFYSGLQIPAISGVKFYTLNMSDLNQKHIILNRLASITNRYTIKAVVAYLTDNYTLYTNQHEIFIVNCLQHLRALQPGVPFALGGCLVEDSFNKESDIKKLIECVNTEKEFITGNQMSLGIFAVPKDEETKPNFDVFSLVIDQSEWSKEKIIDAIREFSESIPRYEHSVALKLSCSGRHQKHEVEQTSFRSFFPKTRIIGCFGNGELGVNHPSRATSCPDPKKRKTYAKYEKIHSYSTVFMYIGWGKVIVPVNVSKHE